MPTPLVLEPIDTYIRAGFLAQVQKTFECNAVYVTANDKTRTLAQITQGIPQYPYIFIVNQSMQQNGDGYPGALLPIDGIPVQVADTHNRAITAKILPVKFEMELTYVSNKEDGTGLDSVFGFSRRWLLRRRLGQFSFNIRYGVFSLPIHCILSDTVTIPQRENATDAESNYQVVVTAAINGYISEPEAGSQGVIDDLQIVQNAEYLMPGQFFPFS